MTTIDAIKARCEAATPGPWFNFGDWMIHTESDVKNSGIVHEKTIGTVKAADADFIAHAREDIPYLLERIAELEGQLEAQGIAAALNYEKLINEKAKYKHLYHATEAQLSASQQRERAMLSDMAHEMECGACCHVRVDVFDEPCASCRRENSKFKWRGPEAGEEQG